MEKMEKQEISAGFFVGAERVVNELIEKGRAMEKAVFDPSANLIEIEGVKFFYDRDTGEWSPIVPYKVNREDDPFPDPITTFTLSGLVDYIDANVEGLIPEYSDGKLILHVVNHSEVRLYSKLSENEKKRYVIAWCKAHVPDITFGKYMDTETFNTVLLSNFIETDARNETFKVVKSMTKEQSAQTSDDGVSQVITVKQGITKASNVQFQNPVPLKPLRTFTEIDQPESNFTLRINQDAQVALFEADGGAWKNLAVQRIKEYLSNALMSKYNIVIIA